MEGGRWLVNLVGVGAEVPPADEEGYQQFLRQMFYAGFAEILARAEPLSPVSGFRNTENRRLYFDLMQRWPGQFLVMGDAACAFNPAYGQGMTVAALEALALARWLKDPQRNSQVFQKRVAKLVNTPWRVAVGEDLRFVETTGTHAGRSAGIAARVLLETPLAFQER